MNACPRCGSTHLRKAGFRTTVKGRQQRWVCVPGKHAFTGQEKFHHAPMTDRQLAQTLAQEGLSVRAIARTVNRFPRAVTLWLEKKVPAPSPPTVPTSNA